MEQLRQDNPGWESVADVPKAEETRLESVPAWHPIQRALFRFLFSYFVLYFPFPLRVIPVYGEILKESYQRIWRVIAPWVGEHVFGVKALYHPTGSGDTAYSYVQVFCYLVLAVAATAVWTLLDRRRANYARLHEWLRVYIRFSLAGAMIVYGAYKVIPSQFGLPLPSDLVQPIGEGSPMWLLWSFMGSSASYIIFTGAAEMLGGLLLVARRTTLLGALVCIGVMSNVVMLNLSYDVPVKLFSSHLLLMAVLLVIPDLGRLASLLVWNRRVPPAEQRPLFASRRGNLAALILRAVFILGVVAASLHLSYKDKMEYEVPMYRQPLYGVWEVEELTVDGAVRPLLITDDTLWRRLVFEWPGVVGIQYMHESEIREYTLGPDPGRHVFTLCCDPEWKTAAAISFKRVEPDLLALEGTVNGKQIRGRFRRMDDARFSLLSRGFHWVSERPFNR
jgi:hypothetical protein